VSGILNWILWLPFLGVLGVLLIPKQKESAIRWWSVLVTAVTLIFCLILYKNHDQANPLMQFVISHPWISQFNIFYKLGIDGISLPMVVINGLLFLICTISSFDVKKNIKGYYALLLALQGSVFGVFMALDFFLFYVFWEVMLLPMFFLIGVWGGENKEYAAIKFFLYTFFGSILMLIGIIALYFAAEGQLGAETFDIVKLMGGHFSDLRINLFGSSFSFEHVFFIFMFVGFAIKVPIFPFHTWLPHAHVQAPTAVSVILAGVLLKMGTYGFMRISYPIFPNAAHYYADMIAWLGLINVIYGALCAMAQTDVKKLIAYSSVSHMGYVMMGIAAMTTEGMNGAVLQMFNHGTSTAMMFLLIGILYERSHHRWIVRPDGSKGFGGLYTQMPKYSIIFIIGMFASLGLPGLSGFISEALIFLGVYQKYTTIAVLALIGLLVGAAYLLWMFKRMFFGPVNPDVKDYSDANGREIFYMTPLAIMVIVFGIYPSPLLNMMKSSVGKLVMDLAKFAN
jgi:NADH-quinone oxidoreductase subunit M